MKYSKTVIASLISISLAFAASASEKQHQVVTITADDNGPAVVKVKRSDNVNIYKISKEALHDPELLSKELANVSDETLEHLTKALSHLPNVSEVDANIELIIDSASSSTDGNQVILHEKSDDVEFEIIIDSEHDYVNHQKVKEGIVIEELHLAESENDQNIKFIIKNEADMNGGMPFSVLKSIFKSTSLSEDQLNELQELLDSKR